MKRFLEPGTKKLKENNKTLQISISNPESKKRFLEIKRTLMELQNEDFSNTEVLDYVGEFFLRNYKKEIKLTIG